MKLPLCQHEVTVLDLQQQEKEPLVFQSNIYISCAVVLSGINPVTFMQIFVKGQFELV